MATVATARELAGLAGIRKAALYSAVIIQYAGADMRPQQVSRKHRQPSTVQYAVHWRYYHHGDVACKT